MRAEYYAELVVRLILAAVLVGYSSYSLYAKQVYVPGLSAFQVAVIEHYYLGVAALLVLAFHLVVSCVFYDAFKQNQKYSAIAVGLSICLMASAIYLG